jgi:hypothetical protein
LYTDCIIHSTTDLLVERRLARLCGGSLKKLDETSPEFATVMQTLLAVESNKLDRTAVVAIAVPMYAPIYAL